MLALGSPEADTLVLPNFGSDPAVDVVPTDAIPSTAVEHTALLSTGSERQLKTVLRAAGITEISPRKFRAWFYRLGPEHRIFQMVTVRTIKDQHPCHDLFLITPDGNYHQISVTYEGWRIHRLKETGIPKGYLFIIL